MLLEILLSLGFMDYFAWMSQVIYLTFPGLCYADDLLHFPFDYPLVISSFFRLPHPSECDLYYVNRDTLFSYHKESEIFLQVSRTTAQLFFVFSVKVGYLIFLLPPFCVCVWHTSKLLVVNIFIVIFELILLSQRMMALYVASHYKNSPNDLQLMADAQSHHLFVLLGMPFLEEPLPPFSLVMLFEDDAHFSLSILDSIYLLLHLQALLMSLKINFRIFCA